MPLTHDIGVRIPYPLQAADGIRKYDRRFLQNGGGMRTPGSDERSSEGRADEVRFAESRRSKASEAPPIPYPLLKTSQLLVNQ